MKPTLASALTLLSLPLVLPAASAQTQTWMRQFGTPLAYWRTKAAVPDGAGGVIVGGYRSYYTNDAWLARYDVAGNQTWMRILLGTVQNRYVSAAASDGSGGAFLIGAGTNNTWPHPPADVWLARFDGAGNQLWLHQFVTGDEEQVLVAGPDGTGGLFACVHTNFQSSVGWRTDLVHYDGAGVQLSAVPVWTSQLGLGGSVTSAVPDGSGGVYLSGSTQDSLGGPNAGATDAWLSRFDSAGNQLWIHQLGTSAPDDAGASAPDGSGGVFLGGSTSGNLAGPNAGNSDRWLAHYDSAGNQLWVRQYGTVDYDGLSALALDAHGAVLAAGTRISGTTPWLVTVTRYDSLGNPLWSDQFGTTWGNQEISVSAIASDGAGGGYFAGTLEDLWDPRSWLAHYDDDSISSYCTSGITTNFCVPQISGTGVPSASATSGFTITASTVEGHQSGLIFYGVDNAGWTAIPWSPASSSYLCVKSPLQRTPVQNSGGTTGACNGVLSLDWNAFVSANPGALGTPFVGGETVYAQGWFRDPPSPKTTNLTNALQFAVFP